MQLLAMQVSSCIGSLLVNYFFFFLKGFARLVRITYKGVPV